MKNTFAAYTIPGWWSFLSTLFHSSPLLLALFLRSQMSSNYLYSPTGNVFLIMASLVSFSLSMIFCSLNLTHLDVVCLFVCFILFDVHWASWFCGLVSDLQWGTSQSLLPLISLFLLFVVLLWAHYTFVVVSQFLNSLFHYFVLFFTPSVFCIGSFY